MVRMIPTSFIQFDNGMAVSFPKYDNPMTFREYDPKPRILALANNIQVAHIHCLDNITVICPPNLKVIYASSAQIILPVVAEKLRLIMAANDSEIGNIQRYIKDKHVTIDLFDKQEERDAYTGDVICGNCHNPLHPTVGHICISSEDDKSFSTLAPAIEVSTANAFFPIASNDENSMPF